MQNLTFRNSHGNPVNVTAVAVEKAPSEFAHIMEQAEQGGAVAITRADAPKAIVMSYDEFEKLVRERSSAYAEVKAEVELMVRQMQTPQEKRATTALLNATPAQLGRAAVRVTRKKSSL